MSTTKAHFNIGQIIQHKLFDYRGVVIDVDSNFEGSEDWYNAATTSKPPKEDPWYHILVDDSYSRTYVAQRNLKPDINLKPIQHPNISDHFQGLTIKGYMLHDKNN
jgi:heat shock protein HspQ